MKASQALLFLVDTRAYLLIDGDNLWARTEAFGPTYLGRRYQTAPQWIIILSHPTPCLQFNP